MRTNWLSFLLITSTAFNCHSYADPTKADSAEARTWAATVSAPDLANLLKQTAVENGDGTCKSVAQMQVRFHDGTGISAESFQDVVDDINDAFGYPKIVGLLSASETIQDGTIVVFLNRKREARSLLKGVADRARAPRGAWDGWMWQNENNEVTKAAVAIYQDDAAVTQESFPAYLCQSVLWALGYNWVIKAPHQSKVPDEKGETPVTESSQRQSLIDERDRDIIRFSDRFLQPRSRNSDIAEVISQQWPRFVRGLMSDAEPRGEADKEN